MHPTGHRFSFSRLRRIAAYEDIAIHTYRNSLLRSGLVRPSGGQATGGEDGHDTVAACRGHTD